MPTAPAMYSALLAEQSGGDEFTKMWVGKRLSAQSAGTGASDWHYLISN